MSDEGFAQRVTKLGALADPVRRRLYRFVAEQPGAVSRDQAAEGLDVPRHTAKFHLDRLVEEGLLVTEFRRLTGRSGPGAGRPAKLYRRSRKEVAVSLPTRRYDLAGQVLADAVERSLDGVPMDVALLTAADNAARIVTEAWPPKAEEESERVAEVLDQLGYEPHVQNGQVSLGNCPFDRLASDHREVVCGMNLEFIGAVGRRLGCTGLGAEPSEGTRCCVRVSPAAVTSPPLDEE